MTTGPNCDTICCDGVCCANGQVCNARVSPSTCCTPDSKGKTCEAKCGTVINNCGQEVNCGACPVETCQNAACNGQNTCVYTPVQDGDKGPNCDGQGQSCCDGVCCANGQTCAGGACCPNARACGAVCLEEPCNSAQCLVCNAQSGTCVSSCNGDQKCCGGTCIAKTRCCTEGTPDVCPSGKKCCGGTCIANSACCDGACPEGKVCCDGTCYSGVCCGEQDCPSQICKYRNCVDHQCQYTNAPNGPTQTCPSPGCCNGSCCTGTQVCYQNACCVPDGNTCQGKCGTVVNNCGQEVNCGNCPGGQICVDHICQGCQNSAQCGEGKVCCDGQCYSGVCCGELDCARQTCKTRACAGHQCQYTNSQNGQPGTNCSAPGKCCNGDCCTGEGQICYQDACCTPQSKETTCNGKCGYVTNNCGQQVNCGDCAVKTCQNGTCGDTHTCNYTPVTNGQPGPNCPAPGKCCNGTTCCTSSQVCTGNGCCTPISICPANACGNVPNGCGGTINCGTCPVETCKSASCTENICVYSNQTNGQPGNNCASPRKCCNGTCCATGQICNTAATPPACCTPISICPANACGSISNGCGGTINCGDCPAVVCKSVACTDHQCVYTNTADGGTTTGCSTNGKKCCKGQCCTSGQVCTGEGCCTPHSKSTTCNGKCGTVTNNCGQQVVCDACAVQTCKTSSCTENICVYTNQTNGQGGSNCPSPKQCCNGVCCGSGKSCVNGVCKDNCGSNPPCGDGKTCCGGTCQTGICCELNEGCTAGTCCDGLSCIDPKDSGSPNSCQKCCQAAKDCRDFFGNDDWVCVGDPKSSAT